MTDAIIPSSFRDPSGFVFRRQGTLYRQINRLYQEHYEHLRHSGLYRSLVEAGLLIPHEEVAIPPADPETAYKIIQPEAIPFVSYPYEWCFSQLRDAALTTLRIQQIALEHGMTLKDASAYNIQFFRGRPILMDTLSLAKYQENQPWVAYEQFCRHFLAPLVLMKYKDYRLNQLLRIYLDGIPLDLASSLLPLHSYRRFGILLHIYLQARMQGYVADRKINKSKCQLSLTSLKNVINSLSALIRKLKFKIPKTEWGDYYQDTNYSAEAFQSKRRILDEFLQQTPGWMVLDLGANDGAFSRIAADQGKFAVCFDNDPAAVEKNYFETIHRGEENILPLMLDLTNPSPGIGWAGRERMSLAARGPADIVLALALIHHLTVSHHLPCHHIAEFFSQLGNYLIIEFVPKSDSQFQRMLATREDIFFNYRQENFEKDFAEYFSIEAQANIVDSPRSLYLMKNRRLS